MSEPVNGADLLRRIKPTLAEESTEICLRPDLVDAWQEAQEELEAIVASGTKGRLGAKPEGQQEAAQRVTDLEAEIQASSAVFRFRALPKDRFRELCDDHPPRKGNDLDTYMGYNRDAVLDEAVRLCMVDPVFDDASWAEFVAVVNGGEWEELRRVVNSVNKGVHDAPKSVLASRILTRGGVGSAPLEPGE